ncbi:MAG TPA: hypothetical protein DCQ06_10630 [Myxococcales bacterium]|nr:hypothetical protein [Myxococcales bacterium]HAN32041.1 hypothetical protein [Myxococcales bacterium]
MIEDLEGVDATTPSPIAGSPASSSHTTNIKSQHHVSTPRLNTTSQHRVSTPRLGLGRFEPLAAKLQSRRTSNQPNLQAPLFRCARVRCTRGLSAP